MAETRQNWFIPGEKEICGDEITDGFLYQTNYRFTAISNKHNENRIIFFNIPAFLIFRVESLNINCLRIYSKLGGVDVIEFKSEQSAATWLKRFTKHLTINSPIDDLFAYVFKKNLDPSKSYSEILLKSKDEVLNTKDVDIIHKEYSRLNFNNSWKISNVNKDFKICYSYPKAHILPKNVDDKSIKLMSNFRGHNRFPSVVWRSKYTGAVLLRCSQPCIGLSCSRNEYDEKFIASVIKSVINDRKNNQIINNKNSYKSGLIIIDARSYSSAQFNRLRGGGLEHPEYYQNCQIEFKDLPNLHHVRQYFEKLVNLIGLSTNMNWFSYLETTNWLTYIGQLLKTAWDIAKKIHIYGQPVMVHCTDGWDRTSQLVSLAEILLDPYYRSIKGFQVLVEREWLMFGHKFGDRCGNGTGNLNVEERSPIFLQWLDCVFQLTKQFPLEFEFNETFLIKLAIHVYSGLFGTFLFNSERERIANKSNEKTCSLWSMLTAEYEDNWTIFNHLYSAKNAENSDQENESQVLILKPRWENRYLQIWLSLYQKGFPTGQDLSLSMNALKSVCSDMYTDSEEEKRDEIKNSSNEGDEDEEISRIPFNQETGNNESNGSLFNGVQSFINNDVEMNNSRTFEDSNTLELESPKQEFSDSNKRSHNTVSTSSSEVGLFIVNGEQRPSCQNSLDKKSQISMDLFEEFTGPEDQRNPNSSEDFSSDFGDSTYLTSSINLPSLANVDGIFINPDSSTFILRKKHIDMKYIQDKSDQTNEMLIRKIKALENKIDSLKEEIELCKSKHDVPQKKGQPGMSLERTKSFDNEESIDKNDIEEIDFDIEFRNNNNIDPEERIKNPSSESFVFVSDLECKSGSNESRKNSYSSNDLESSKIDQKCKLFADLTKTDTKLSYESGFLCSDTERTPTSSMHSFSYKTPSIKYCQSANPCDTKQVCSFPETQSGDDEMTKVSSSSQCALNNIVSA